MSELGALDRQDARSACETETRLPPWQILGRCVALARAVRGATAEASRQSSSALEFSARAQRTAVDILERHAIKVDRSGERPPAPALIASNHLGYLDALVIASLVPCIAIAKAETGRWPLFGEGLRALGVLFVSRDNPMSGAVALRRALRALRNGARVLNFPEGTTTDGGAIRPFRRGCFGLALWASIPVVPTRIVYDDDRVPWIGGQPFGPHYLRLAGVPTITARVYFGEPILVRSSDDPSELAVRTRQIMGQLGS